MKLNKIKKMMGFVLLITLIFPNLAYAAERDKNLLLSSEVFPKEKVVELQEVNRQQKVVADFKKATRDIGNYPTRKGVILVTDDKYKGLLPLGHAAIIYSSTTVVESTLNGVTTGPNNWSTSKQTCSGVTVIGTTASQDSKAANWCYDQIGKPYNYNFLNPYTRSKFYCSQLVYAAFLDNFDIDLDTSKFLVAVHPAELVSSSKTSMIYRK